VPLPKGLESVAQPLASIAAVKAKRGIQGLVMAVMVVMPMSPGGGAADVERLNLLRLPWRRTGPHSCLSTEIRKTLAQTLLRSPIP
jgi:hypothetical protein